MPQEIPTPLAPEVVLRVRFNSVMGSRAVSCSQIVAPGPARFATAAPRRGPRSTTRPPAFSWPTRTTAAHCDESNPGPKSWWPATEVRIALVDPERGVVIGYSI